MTPALAQQYFNSFINYEIHLDKPCNITFKLERVQKLLTDLGNPQKNLKIIHVAGSKGKGSVCALAASILKSAGYKVGLYTSPHMNSYRERIRVLQKTRRDPHTDGIFSDMISEEELCESLGEIVPTVESNRSDQLMGRLTFFEVYTALALYYFSRQSVDIVVLETGMGGRLDATNAVESLIAAITPISLEHTDILGTDITQIAREKAAIIKNAEQKAVIAPQEPLAGEVLKKRCAQYKIDPLWVEKYMHCDLIEQNLEAQTFDLTSHRDRYHLTMPLLGGYQRDNAAVAVGIMECLTDFGFSIATEAVEEGIKEVFWPGRFEIAGRDPLMILDGAHNKASVSALVQLITELFDEQKVTLVLGISRDKDVTSICEEFAKVIKNTIFVKSDHPRAKNLPGALSVKKALDLVARKCAKDDIVVIAGSLFVVSDARTILKDLKKGHQRPRVPVPQ